ncbi:hypothetical protein LBMAG46_33300 [Planctomycetia bacterium]|nr:hypothetical protein LBMAG46_33300 [Planctomycetia bacterium]
MFADGETQFADSFQQFRMHRPRQDSQSHIGNIRSGETYGHDPEILSAAWNGLSGGNSLRQE